MANKVMEEEKMFQKRPRDMLSHTFSATHYLKTEGDVGREVEGALSESHGAAETSASGRFH